MIDMKLNTLIYGDCTAGYVVKLDKEYTVKEFIDELLAKNEWGEVSIYCEDAKHRIKYHGRNNVIECDKKELLLKKIKKVDDAYGGWGCFDYTIHL